ncbi:hypothetical protein M407DRAFT_11793 [Tulasnella calospora MUT 4182]|uniref:Uncharacterized protein n=1 Tax=Tulasnella calospora MUT 4182 TaxID=1051891 RepID=A0A0C3Q555_9AGAM|nr:hypothetical protein M407DRAFT_11793 [Tulasnella calospora MUT 4182]
MHLLDAVLLSDARSGREYGCFVVPSHKTFDLATLCVGSSDWQEEVTIEPCGFIAGGEVDLDVESSERLELARDQPTQDVDCMGSGKAKELAESAARLRNRDKKRKRREQEDLNSEQAAKQRLHFLTRATLVKSEDYAVKSGLHAKSGYVGIVDRGLDFAFLDGPAGRRIRCLLRHQYEMLEFDKLPAEYPICDRQGKIFAVVLGWPEGWDSRTEGANRAMERLQEALSGLDPPPNRRGSFAAYAFGYSFGGGQQEPLPFKRSRRESEAIQEFLNDPDVQAVLKYIQGGRITSSYSVGRRFMSTLIFTNFALKFKSY